MSVHNLRIRASGARPERLDNLLAAEITAFLARTEPGAAVSRAKIRRLIIAGAVSVNGRQERRPERAVPSGSNLLVKLDTTRFFHEKQPDDISFELEPENVLYEDEWLLIVNKPARFPTEATIVDGRDNLHAACKRYLARHGEHRNTPYCGLLHRLDRETSGVILFSKTRTVNAAIQEQFVTKTIQKMYLALTLAPKQHSAARERPVVGSIPVETGKHPATSVTPDHSTTHGARFSVQNRLARITPKSSQGKWGSVPAGGDEALTDFEFAEERNGLLLIRAWPRTGRTHQIRVHLAGLGLPILGDALYGGVTEFHDMTFPRCMLHATELEFVHPVSGERVCVTAPVPGDFITATKIVETKNR